jgi:ADP-heptose:LPS heptosyltransferase
MRRLLIRSGGIGDCILAFPALEHLKTEYTEIWVPSVVVPLIQFADVTRSLASTGIDLLGVGDLEPRPELIKMLRSFDSIVSWYGAERSDFRCTLEKLGLRCEFHPALPPADYDGHATDFFAQQVGAPLGLQARIDLNTAPPRDSIVIHPFSGSARKNWPLECFTDLASRMNCEVEWTAGPEEELAAAHRFADLRELAAWMRGARLYIGNDSGITHLSAATGSVTIALFGCPESARTWGPRGDNVTILCSDPITRLEVATVLDAVNRRLAAF